METINTERNKKYQVVNTKEEILPFAEAATFAVTEKEYAGNMILHTEPICASAQDAYAYLITHASIPDLAVSFYDTSEMSPTVAQTRLHERLIRNRTDRAAYNTKHTVKNHKAKLLTCRNCESRLAKEFLGSDICPVCQTDLRAEYVTERILKYDDDYETIKQQLSDSLIVSRNANAPIKWCVGVDIDENNQVDMQHTPTDE